MKKLERYSIGMGDRFGRQGIYQLRAVDALWQKGVPVVPVWNKSHREQLNTSTTPESVQKEAQSAAKAMKWNKSYHIDADHITMDTVADYLSCSDYFTIDVAGEIGQTAHETENRAVQFLDLLPASMKNEYSRDELDAWTRQYGSASQEAGRIYRFIEDRTGKSGFIAEVSMDEVKRAQEPREFFFILFLLKAAGVYLQAIAPKFPGRFNKGVDYAGDPKKFGMHFEQYLIRIEQAREIFGLPENLKLSIHTGSDKFSLYPIIGALIRKHNQGIHLKTAGTTWLEEVAGLAGAGETEYVCSLYRAAFYRREELTAAYSDVIDIDPKRLPAPEELSRMTSDMLAATIRHSSSRFYNPHVRQLMHTAYKIAAENKDELLRRIDQHAEHIGRSVTNNILQNHLIPLFQ